MALIGAQFVQAVQPVPVGSLQAFAGANAPTGWLLCDGTSYSTSVYPELFSVLSYTYGGSGANFTVPDLRGRMPIGAGNEGVAANNVARTVGAKGGDTRLQSHTHTGTTGNGSANHSHTLRVNGNSTLYLANVAGGSGGFGVSSSVGSSLDVWENGASHTHTFTSNDHNQSVGTAANMPPFLVTNYIIKALPDVPRQGVALGNTPPIVTSLPANPQFGEVVTFAADATNGIYWDLQYDATGTYPWKFIGGVALYNYVATAQSTTTTASYVALATAGPSLTLARAGDYDITIGATSEGTGNNFMSYDIGATGAVDADAIVQGDGSSTPRNSVVGMRRKTAIAANSAIVAKYKAGSAGGGAFWRDRWMSITPIRVA